MNKAWLDMSPYGLQLFLARGKNPSDHFIALTGEGIEENKVLISSLGFKHDARPQFNKPGGKRFWICPASSITLGTIKGVFPQADVKEMPVEVIFPAAQPKPIHNLNVQQTSKAEIHESASTSSVADQPLNTVQSSGGEKLSARYLSESSGRLKTVENLIEHDLKAGRSFDEFLNRYFDLSGAHRRDSPYFTNGRVDLDLAFDDLLAFGYQVDGQPEFELLWNKVLSRVTQSILTEKPDPVANQIFEEPAVAPEVKPVVTPQNAKWFGSKEKADAFIAKRKLGSTHEVVFDGRARWEIKLLSEQPINSKQEVAAFNAEAHVERLVVETIDFGQKAARKLFADIVQKNNLKPSEQIEIKHKFQIALKDALTNRENSLLDSEPAEPLQPWQIRLADFTTNSEANPYFAKTYPQQGQVKYLDEVQEFHREAVLQAVIDGKSVPDLVAKDYETAIITVSNDNALTNVLSAGLRARVEGAAGNTKTIWIAESSNEWLASEMSDDASGEVIGVERASKTESGSKARLVTKLIAERQYFKPSIGASEIPSKLETDVPLQEDVGSYDFPEAKGWPDSRFDHFKSILTDTSLPSEIPAGWIAMNSTRPLLGQVFIANGPYLSGRYYVGIDPDDPATEGFIQKNYDLDASVILTASLETQVQLALVNNPHKLRYLALDFDTRVQALTPILNAFKGKLVGKIKALAGIANKPLGTVDATLDAGLGVVEKIDQHNALPVQSAEATEPPQTLKVIAGENSYVGDNTGTTTGTARGRFDANGAPANGVLGVNMPSPDAEPLPGASGQAKPGRGVDTVSPKSTTAIEGGGASAEKELEAKEPSNLGTRDGLYGQNSLGERLEAVRTRGAARRVEQELPAFVDRSTELDTTPSEGRVWTGLTSGDLAYTTGENLNTSAHVLTAIKTLLRREAGESLTKAERSTLAAFRGWGGVAGALRTDNRQAYENRLGKDVAELLGISPESFNQLVLNNRLESYYTPGSYGSAIWQSLKHLGVRSDARVLDAGCGGAVFFASAPAEFQRDATMVGIECDPIATRFARAIAPEAKIIENRYENVVLSKNAFDCVVGNVPFGETKIFDKEAGESLHIHDFFILKSLKHLKVGGIMSVITSSGTMDKQDPSIRQLIMENANLVAAYRLPLQAFDDQKASVTTDILIFQKRPRGTRADYDFTQTDEVVLSTADAEESKTVSVNRYFKDNPGNVLGKAVLVSSAFGLKYSVQLELARLMNEQDKQYSSHHERSQAAKHAAIAGAIEQRIQGLPKDLVNRTEWPRDDAFNFTSADIAEVSSDSFLLSSYDGLIGDYTLNEGNLIEIVDILPVFDNDGLLVSQSFVAQPLSYLKPGEQILISDYIPLRNETRRLVKCQLTGDDEELKIQQAALRDIYDRFVSKYGPINSDKVSRIIEDDSGSAEVCALEVWNEKDSIVVQLADIFTKRVINPAKENQIAETPSDALALCIDRKGRIDFEFMQSISSFSKAQLIDELVGKDIFKNPESEDYELRSQYLSGNVIKKLRIAEQTTLVDQEYEGNVAALRNALPDKIPFEEITIKIGAGWIPADDVRRFTTHLFDCPELGEKDFRVRHIPSASLWTVEVSDSFKKNYVQARTTLYGHKSASYESLLEKLLNGSRPTHKHEVDGRSVVDEESTLLSSELQKKINEEFNKWVGEDKERRLAYTELYNEANNIFVVPKPDGSRLTFPGMSAAWSPMEHQSGAVAMAMMGYNFLAAHPVGSGKTFEEVAIAIKLKQLGIVTKPAIAVPNHMLGQIAREAKHMFPAAKILMITQDDLRGKSRKRFLSVARNNDWDLVVMTHSMLNQISAPRDIVEGHYTSQIAEVNTLIDNCDSQRVTRQLVAKRKTLENKLFNLKADLDAEDRSGARVYINELGIDLLNVDEWHLYKNLELNSSMNVLGVTSSGSQRASNLEQLGLYLQRHWGKPFGLNGFTGTVISNTMCELYVHNKMLRPDLLHQMDIYSFDDWASRFGEIVTSLEALPEGGGYKVSERFAKFVNLPEMLSLFRSFTDVRSKAELNLPTPELRTEVISVPQTLWQKAHMKHLANRAVAVRNRRVSPAVDNLLKIATDGRKASVDMRLCESDLPDDCSLKLETAAKNIHLLWERYDDHKATQLVFLDLGTPGKDKEFVAYDAMAKVLFDLGIPKDQVAFIHDFKNPETKEDAFERFRAGELRVLFGSTEKMGVGTNVQNRLIAVHHVDTGWNPSSTEQRNGRVDRRGNELFGQVWEFRYTTTDSFDLFMWETNKRKADFINQALADPKHAGREVSEEMDLGYAEVLAVTTGNPLIREKVMIDDTVVKLQRQQRSWSSEKNRVEEALSSCERNLAWENRQLKELVAASNYLPQTGFKPVRVQGMIKDLQDGDTSWLYAKEVGLALKSRLPFLEARLMSSMERTVPLNVTVGEIDLHLRLDRTGGVSFAIHPVAGGELLAIAERKLGLNISSDPVSLGRSIRDLYSLREYHMDKTLSNVQRFEAEVKRLVGGAVRSDRWDGEAELTAALARQYELNRHFASQVANLETTDDPYLEMLEDYRSQMMASTEESAFLSSANVVEAKPLKSTLLDDAEGFSLLPNNYAEAELFSTEKRYSRLTPR